MARPNKTDNTAGVNRKEERRGRIKKGKYQCGVNVSTDEKKRKEKNKATQACKHPTHAFCLFACLLACLLAHLLYGIMTMQY